MGHPFAAHRQNKVEHSRVGHITKGYASGGAVKGYSDDDSKVRKMSASQEREVNPEGGVAKHRMDRPGRKKGGRVKKADGGSLDNSGFMSKSISDPATKISGKLRNPFGYGRIKDRPPMEIKGPTPSPSNEYARGGKVKGKSNSRTIVNVITGGHPAGGAVPTMPAPPPPPGLAGAALPPPPMAAKPPMMPPPGGPPMGPGGPPPMPMRKSGGRVNQGTKVFEQSKRSGTQVSHDNGKADLPDIGRKRVVTFMAGGAVKSFMAGGRVEASDKIAPATKLPGGSGGGLGRLSKEHRAERKG